MRVTIRQSFEPRVLAAPEPDVSVFFDVFRASTTLAALVSQGPAAIHSTNDPSTAATLVTDGYTLVSEVFAGGLDNSPTQVLAAGLGGRRIVHKSTNLTTAVFHNLPMRLILIAGFCNARATAAALVKGGYDFVELVPAGHVSRRRAAPEDSAAAEAVAALLSGADPTEPPRLDEIAAMIAVVRERGGQAPHYFADVALALEFDRFPYVIEATPMRDGLIEIKGRPDVV